MSLITRCPACGTMFRVVPDQLRISDGWVRCGHCSDVFDASSHLQTEAPAQMPAAATPAEEAPPPSQPASTSPAQTGPAGLIEQAVLSGPSVFSPDTPVPTPMPAPLSAPASFSPFNSPDPVVAPAAPVPAAFDAGLSGSVPQELAPPSPWGTTPAPISASIYKPLLADEAAFIPSTLNETFYEEIITPPMYRPALPDDATDAVDETDATEKDGMQPKDAEGVEEAEEALKEPRQEARDSEQAREDPTESTIEDMSFVRDARRKAFWRRPMVRVALGVFSVVLLVLLALQVAVQERDRLAVLEPRAKPWLDELCAPLKCAVAPLRQIESLVIESSSFNKVRGNVYRLSVSVKNKAPFPLAMPGIELALTDSQDQPVLRRVLLPAELGAAAVIAPGAEWSGTLPVSVGANSQTARISGYRLLAFYP